MEENIWNFFETVLKPSSSENKKRKDVMEEENVWSFFETVLKPSSSENKTGSLEEDAQKEELRKRISDKDVNALLDYCVKYYETRSDLLFLLRVLPIFVTIKPCFDVWCEYARIIWLCWSRNMPSLTPKQYELCCEKIIENLDLAMRDKPKNAKAYLYYARFYKYNPQYKNLKKENLQEKAEKYYNTAIKYGSRKAVADLKFFLRQKRADTALELLNTDRNLNKFIKDLKESQSAGIFNLLLYGPEGSGKLRFAYKLMKEMEKPYFEITADMFQLKNRFKSPGAGEMSLKLKIDECSNKGNRVALIHHADLAFSLKSGDAFSGYQNTVSLSETIRDNNCSLVLIVNDIKNLPSELVNAFTFRIKFNYMEDAQKQAAYGLFFDKEPPKELSRIGNLVVEDFARLKKRALVENFITDDAKLLETLQKEAEFKAGGSSYLKPEIEFDEMLVNADIGLAELTSKLQDKKETPFTMIVYGAPGTGKSYYLRYLAEKMRINTIETTAAELFSTYQGEPAKNVTKLFRRAEEEQAMIILDEIEEIIGSRDGNMEFGSWRRDMTNAFLTCLENSKIPFACTTNYLEKIDKAILRRFVFKLKFDYLTKGQTRYAFKHAFKMEPPEELDKIGGLTNGDFSTVKKKAIILDVLEDKAALLSMLKEEAEKKALVCISAQADNINFDRGFINTDMDALDLFVRNIKRENKADFSMLLYGPSGTGKSLYLRHLASELGYEVIERRASDILSKWYGESQQNLAAAFEEAKKRRAFLVFDEIDGFLQSKKGIHDMHNTMLINEFLVQLENHPYPVGGTTNYIENMEQASLRRFKFKAEFSYLLPEQYDYVYRKTFGTAPEKSIEKLKKLTPSLFSLAYEKADLTDALGDSKKVWEIFMKEAEKASAANAKDEEDKTYKKLCIPAKPLYDKPIDEMYNEVLKGFVKIISDDGHGSGFVISEDGFILTNRHVVEGCSAVTVELFSGREVAGEVLRTNSFDVALIKISKQNSVVPMPLRLSELNIGQTVFSMGNPGSHDQVMSRGSITRYTKDSLGRKRIEADNFAFGGVSGGPLMDKYGNVIGINVAGWLDPETNYKTRLGLSMQVPIIEALQSLNISLKEK